MDLRLLFREVPAPGDLFLLSWRPCVLPHPSQLPELQFGLLRANCLCWGREILLCRADKIQNIIKAGLKPLSLFWLLSGAVAVQDGSWKGWLCLGAMTEGFSQREAATEVCVTYVCLPVEKTLNTSESWEVLEEEISRRLGRYQVPDLVLLGEQEKNQHRGWGYSGAWESCSGLSVGMQLYSINKTMLPGPNTMLSKDTGFCPPLSGDMLQKTLRISQQLWWQCCACWL